MVRTIVNPLAPNQFWTNFNFAEKGVVLDEELEINVPKARHVTLKTKPGYDPKVTEEGDRRIYRWTHSHQPSGKAEKASPPCGPGAVGAADDLPELGRCGRLVCVS